MPLNNAQYDALMREYEQKQFQSHQEKLIRQNNLYLRIPEMRELDSEMAALSVESAIASLDSNDDSHSVSLHRQLEDIRHRRFELMRSAGFPTDYLDDIYECPDCHDTGFIDNEKCHCLKQRIIDLIYSQSHIGDILHRENFDTFSFEYYSTDSSDPLTGMTSLECAKKAYDSCMRFVQNFAEEGGNIFLTGSTGTGKTFLSNCIAKALLDKGYSVIYFTADGLFDIFTKSAFSHDSDSYDAKSQILECDLLIIDDLGTELPNSLTISQLYQCINDRLLRDKSTVISTNLTVKDLRNTYFERITSRITSNYKFVSLFGDDIRLMKV